MIQSFLLLVVAIFGLFLPVIAQHQADTGQKTETACRAEWRANGASKGASRTKGMTQDAFVAQCRTGHPAAQVSRSSAGPSTDATASPLQKPSHPSAHAAQPRGPEQHSRRHTRSRIERHASRAARADWSGGF
jgi:hypothetical protein